MQVTFVSVTQAFNTTTSMGRLTLNVLLSFAQFEREVIGERIRDKFAASRRTRHVDGRQRTLRLRRARPASSSYMRSRRRSVRSIFERFSKVASATTLAGTLAREGVLTPRGKPIDKGWIYKLLTNRLYVGDAVHKGTAYPGEHQAIVTRALWEKVHADFAREPAQACRRYAVVGAGLVEGADLRPDRLCHVADPHP